MRFPARMIDFATMHAAAALAAVFLVAAPAAAQSAIEITPETATTRAGRWVVTSDSTASGGGMTMRHPDQGAAKLTTALASPTNYFEVTFTASAGIPYQLLLLGKADNNYWGNDSVFVQFSGSVSSTGSSRWRIGTISATEVNLEDCSGCGLSGWKWQDNGYGTNVIGERVYFATTGTQRMRIQTREDGLSIDTIRLVPEAAAAVPAPTPTSAVTLKVMEWNTHHGIGTDGRYDISRFIPYIVNSGANVVSLNEVEKNVGS